MALPSGFWRSFRRAAAAAMVFSGGLAITGQAAVAAVEHAPHRAFYDITLGTSEGGSPVLEVRGRMVAEWSQACEGWNTSQRLAVSIVREEGEPAAFEVLASSFESHDGTRYSFTSKTMIDGKAIEEVRGHASRRSRDAAGEAVYTMPADVRIALPAGTLFPFEHTLTLIAAAERGANVDYSYYFDGSQPEVSPLGASALIIGGVRDPAQGPGAGLGPLTARKWWSVRLAMFPQARETGEPEFEMTQDLQDNGIVRRFVFDYGDFTMVAALLRVEALPEPVCK